MHCTEAHNLLDDHLDGLLDQPHSDALADHLQVCTACRAELAERQALLARLHRLPLEAPAPGFAARALYRTRQKRAQHTRGFLTGFGSTVAAGVALWVAAGFWQPAAERTTPHVQSITLQVQQPRTVSLAFNVPQQDRYDRVRFRIILPPGVSLADRPGKREIAWQDRLEPGRNLLSLPLVAEPGTRGELIAQIEVQGKKKTFRIPVRAGTREGAWRGTEPPATPA